MAEVGVWTWSEMDEALAVLRVWPVGVGAGIADNLRFTGVGSAEGRLAFSCNDVQLPAEGVRGPADSLGGRLHDAEEQSHHNPRVCVRLSARHPFLHQVPIIALQQ